MFGNLHLLFLGVYNKHEQLVAVRLSFLHSNKKWTPLIPRLQGSCAFFLCSHSRCNFKEWLQALCSLLPVDAIVSFVSPVSGGGGGGGVFFFSSLNA